MRRERKGAQRLQKKVRGGGTLFLPLLSFFLLRPSRHENWIRSGWRRKKKKVGGGKREKEVEWMSLAAAAAAASSVSKEKREGDFTKGRGEEGHVKRFFARFPI